jgi:hypothetical protein
MSSRDRVSSGMIRAALAAATIICVAALVKHMWGQQKATLVGIVLPAAAPGEQVSGTIVMDPDSYRNVPGLHVTDVHLDLPYGKNGQATLAGVVVDTGDKRFQPADKPFTMAMPPVKQPHVVLRISTTPKTLDGSQNVEVGAGEPFLLKNSGQTLMPPISSVSGLDVIHAPVKGDASKTHIDVDGRPVEIIAERPGSVFWLVPDSISPGKRVVTLQDGGLKLAFPICVTGLQVTADRRLLHRGESTQFHISITGLGLLGSDMWRSGVSSDLVDVRRITVRASGFHVPLPDHEAVFLLRIENSSPEIITMQEAHDNVIVLRLARLDFRQGTFSYSGSVSAKADGEFRLDVELTPFFAEVAPFLVANPQPTTRETRRDASGEGSGEPIPGSPPRGIFQVPYEETATILRYWGVANRIKLTEAATGLIQGEFWREKSQISDAVNRQNLDVPGRSRLYAWLVESYLYDLRDRTLKGVHQTRSPALFPTGVAQSWLQGSSGGKLPVIDTPQVQEFPVMRYLSSLLPLFQGAVGRMYITSAPDGSSIAIDGKGHGDTCKKFVTSVGRHSVGVSSKDGKTVCENDVMVGPDEVEHFSCPRNTDCPKK